MTPHCHSGGMGPLGMEPRGGCSCYCLCISCCFIIKSYSCPQIWTSRPTLSSAATENQASLRPCTWQWGWDNIQTSRRPTIYKVWGTFLNKWQVSHLILQELATSCCWNIIFIGCPVILTGLLLESSGKLLKLCWPHLCQLNQNSRGSEQYLPRCILPTDREQKH